MDGAYFPEQTENDDRSGIPMRSVSVNNLHISTDSFKYYRSLRGQNVNPPPRHPTQLPLNKVIFTSTLGGNRIMAALIVEIQLA